MSAAAAAPVSFAVDADGVGWIAFDDPAGRANVFTSATLDALDAALAVLREAVAAGRVRAAVIVSGKERIFIAGADLKWLGALRDAAEARAVSRRGQRLFQRVADMGVPVVAAIHGACAGGGLELALACQWRIASDAPATQIGLPETSIGTIPGWGGSVRLPRLIGVRPALEHILRGQLVSAREAREAGIVNEIAAPTKLRAQAKAAALRLAAEGVPAWPPQAALPAVEIAALRAEVERRSGRTQPALLAALDAVERTAELKLADALDLEAQIFGEVTAGETCKNLVRVFFLKEAAKKRTLEAWFSAEEAAGAPLPGRVGVVGAGVMGSGIAQWLAAKGFAVMLRDADPAALERGMTAVRELFDEAVTRGKMEAGGANAALQRVEATTGWDGFAGCDLVIEAIVEDVAAKRALFGELATIVAPTTVLASNTSALPIDQIAGHVSRPERIVGMHFFNPVSRMALVELVLAPTTTRATAERALALAKALGKSTVVCRSSPGFLVTRVLFFYLNAAVRAWEDGVTTEELDGGLRAFGWPMGPLRLIDEVGVDVTGFIFRELETFFPGRFARTTTCERMLAAGLKGRKGSAGRGFYRYDGRGEAVNRDIVPASASAARRADGRLAETLTGAMADEARRCLDEGVVKSEDDIDFALLAGAGFPAWRGGLLRWAAVAARDKPV